MVAADTASKCIMSNALQMKLHWSTLMQNLVDQAHVSNIPGVGGGGGGGGGGWRYP